MNEQRKKQMIIAGALVAVVAVVLVFVVFRRRGGEEPLGPAQPAASAETPAGGAAQTVAPGATGAGGIGVAAVGVGPMGAAARPAGASAAPAGASGGDMGSPMHPPKDAKQPPFKPRPDPFKSFPLPKEWLEELRRRAVAAQPPPIYVWGLPAAAAKTAQVTRLVEATPPGALQTVGAQRMSGILFDGRVWAILETDDGQSRVVKPGDVMDNGARVAAVSRDSMVIAQAGQRQNVELKGKPLAAATATRGVTPGVPGAGRAPGGTVGGAMTAPVPGPSGPAGGELEEL